MIPISRLKNLKIREVEWLTQSHTALYVGRSGFESRLKRFEHVCIEGGRSDIRQPTSQSAHLLTLGDDIDLKIPELMKGSGSYLDPQLKLKSRDVPYDNHSKGLWTEPPKL